MPTTTAVSDTYRALTGRQYLEQLRGQLDIERSSFMGTWRELADYTWPRGFKRYISDTNRGERRDDKIVDATATIAARTLSAGMHAGITSPARPWFRLTVPDQQLAEQHDVKEWLAAVTRRMAAVFLRSNLYDVLPSLYKGGGVFATSAALVEEHQERVFRLTPVPLGTFWVANDPDGMPNVFMREFRMTVRQLVDKFGRPPGATVAAGAQDDSTIDWARFSIHVRNLWERRQRDAWINVVHAILPNEEYDVRRPLDPTRAKPWRSVYYERGTSGQSTDSYLGAAHAGEDAEKVLREGGFDRFPVLVFVWETTSTEDSYGTDCPGITALGDVKQLQKMEKRGLQALEKMVNPPLKGPTSLRNVKVSLLPGDVTYVEEASDRGQLVPLIKVDPKIRELSEEKAVVRGRIEEAFLVSMFLMLATRGNKQMTATEVAELHEEKLLMIGPALEKLNQRVLDPLIDLAFDYMLRQGWIPEPPEAIAGQDLRVEYVSVMAQAQKLVSRSSVEQLVQFVLALAQARPDALDKLDVDQVVDEYAEILGVTPGIVHSAKEVAAIRVQKLREQQAAMMAANARQITGAVKDLATSPAPEAGAAGQDQTVLSRIAEGLAGAAPGAE